METETFLLMFIHVTVLVSEIGVGTFLCIASVAYALPHYHLPEKMMLQAMIWFWTGGDGIWGRLEVYLFICLFIVYFNALYLLCWRGQTYHSTYMEDMYVVVMYVGIKGELTESGSLLPIHGLCSSNSGHQQCFHLLSQFISPLWEVWDPSLDHRWGIIPLCPQVESLLWGRCF